MLAPEDVKNIEDRSFNVQSKIHKLDSTNQVADIKKTFKKKTTLKKRKTIKVRKSNKALH